MLCTSLNKLKTASLAKEVEQMPLRSASFETCQATNMNTPTDGQRPRTMMLLPKSASILSLSKPMMVASETISRTRGSTWPRAVSNRRPSFCTKVVVAASAPYLPAGHSKQLVLFVIFENFPGGTRRPRQRQVRQSIPLLFDFVPDKRVGHSDPRGGTQIHVQHRNSTVLHLRRGGRPKPIARLGKGLRHLDRDTGTFDRFCGTRKSQHGDRSHSDHGRSRPYVGTCPRHSLRALLFVLVASPSTTHNGLNHSLLLLLLGIL